VTKTKTKTFEQKYLGRSQKQIKKTDMLLPSLKWNQPKLKHWQTVKVYMNYSATKLEQP